MPSRNPAGRYPKIRSRRRQESWAHRRFRRQEIHFRRQRTTARKCYVSRPCGSLGRHAARKFPQRRRRLCQTVRTIMSMENVAVIGTGMTRFGKHQDFSLKTLGGEAIRHALADAGLEASDIDAAFVANAMAGITTGQVSIVGQTILEANGFHSIPVFNIDNACASSSCALHLAVQYIRAGAADTVLVLGAEKLICADRTKAYIALNGAADIDFVAANDIDVTKASIFVSAVYPPRLEAYQQKFGLDAQPLAQIAVKNRNHAAHNPNAQFTTPLTVDE